jgi:predicted MPP superfamily phosphohydrolase
MRTLMLRAPPSSHTARTTRAHSDLMVTRFTLLMLLVHGYVAVRLLPAQPDAFAMVAVALWLVASLALLPHAMSARRRALDAAGERLALVGLVAMGSFSSLFVLTVLRDGVLALAHAVQALAGTSWPLAELARDSAAAVPFIAAVLTAVGYANARRRARVRSVDVAIRDLPEALHGFTIAQISDVHIGPTIKGDYLERIVDAVNAIEADMIAITGDLVDGSVRDLRVHTASLARLTAPHGTFFVTGNHEYYSGAGAWIAELRRLGVSVLVNEHVVLRHRGAAVVVAGVTDFSAHHFDPAHRSDPVAAVQGAPADAGVKVLLAHQPRSAFAAAQAGFDLQLSGHTHGGQFLPWNFFVRLQQPFTAGLYRLHDLWVYVSRGTGYWGPPKRLGAPSEITRLRLVPA